MSEIVRFRCPCCSMLVLGEKIEEVLSAENDFEVQVQKRVVGENGFGKAKRPRISGRWLKKKKDIAENMMRKAERMLEEYEQNKRIYRCPKCETVVGKDDEYCPNCGANFLPVIDMAEKLVIFVEDEEQYECYCEKCESLVDENATECPHCGVEFVDEDER